MNKETQNLHFDWYRIDGMQKVHSSDGDRSYPTYCYKLILPDWKITAVKRHEELNDTSLDIIMDHFYFGACWSPPFNQPYPHRIARNIEDADRKVREFMDNYEKCRGDKESILEKALSEFGQ